MATKREDQRAPGTVRDAIMRYLARVKGDASMREIYDAVRQEVGDDVAPSSVRSYLALNTPRIFERTAHGRYKMAGK